MDKLAYGTGCFSDYSEKESYFLLMDRFYEHSKTFDTARSYNEWLEGGENISEYMLGEWMKLRNNRNELVVITKGGFPKNLKSGTNVQKRINKKELMYDIETSLSIMGIDYVDVFLLHRDDTDLPVEEIVPILDDMVKQGKTRFVGVSNWSANRVQQALEFAQENDLAPISIVQNFFSLAQSTPERFNDPTIICMNDEEYSWYAEHSMPFMAYTSQAKGFFTKYNNGTLTKQGDIEKFLTDENIERAKRAQLLADEYSVSATAIALAYLANNKVQTSAVIGTKSLAQLEDSLKVKDIVLSEAQIEWLTAKK